ncbi:MAG: hypothetical protein LBD28_02305 [Tannerellaceae bacterium]|jgi:acetyltransferase-like isoleucine patch superfamily enzyme|nr:hypothetical protein [Tannerellaceae bacterium]
MNIERLKRLFHNTKLYFINWRGELRINLLKTIWYNFRCLPFGQACRLPLRIHCKVKVYKMGKIRIEGEVTPAMIIIGGYNLKGQGYTKILNRGEIVFRGKLILGGGCIIENSGQIIFEGETLITECVTFLIQRRLHVGAYGRIGFYSTIMDTDYHYMININTGEVRENCREIVIGPYNWIGGRTIVKKGVRTPAYTIVASGSMLTKDYTATVEPFSTLAGAPAKFIATGWRRIYNLTEEKRLNQYFRQSGAEAITIDLEGLDLDAFCTNDALKFI